MDKFEIVGTIKLFAGKFCPDGYLYCDGQTISITSNIVLYNIILYEYNKNNNHNNYSHSPKLVMITKLVLFSN